MIVLDDRVLQMNAGGTVSAGIWLTFPTGDFPAKGWDDFAVAILIQIARAILEVAHDPPASRYISFFEGPLGVELEWHAGAMKVLAIRRAPTRRVVVVQRVEPAAFNRNLIEVSRQLLGWCDARGWTSEEIEALRQLTVQLGEVDRPSSPRARTDS